MMIKKELSRREKIIFMVCIVLVGLYGVVQFVVRPFKERQETIDQKIYASERRLEKNQHVIKAAQDADRQYAAIFKMLRQSGSDDAERSAMLSTIQDIANQTGVNIANMQPQKVLSKEFYKEFSVQLMVEGSWSSIVQFLHHVQDQPNYFDIEETNLEKNSTNNASIRGRLTLSRMRVPST